MIGIPVSTFMAWCAIYIFLIAVIESVIRDQREEDKFIFSISTLIAAGAIWMIEQAYLVTG